MLGKARELFDLPLVVCVFILFTALEYSEAFTLVEDELLSYRQVFRHASGDQQAVKPLPNVRVIYTDEAFYDEYQAYPLRRETLNLDSQAPSDGRRGYRCRYAPRFSFRLWRGSSSR